MKVEKTQKMLTVVITVILIAASCGSESEVESKLQSGVKVISLESAIGNERVVYLSEVASAVDYIPLETSEESLVGMARHIMLENDVIYLPEGSGIQKLSRFSLSGEYLGSVGKRGRAFGEYVRLDGFSFDYDYQAGIEMIYDRGNKLIEYYPDGSIKEITVESPIGKNFSVNFIKKHGDIYIAAIGIDGTKTQDLIFLDSCGTLIGDFPDGYSKGDYQEKVGGTLREGGMIVSFSPITSLTPLYRYKEQLMILNGSKDTIFSFKSNSTVANVRYVVDMGKFINEKDEFGSLLIKFIASFTRESNKHLFMTFNLDKYKPALNKEFLARVLFNKETNQTTVLINSLVNDIDGGISFWPQHISRDGKMVSVIGAIDFIDAAKESKSQKMKEVAATLTEESNPVVMVVTP
ncbi:MAG: 6-bladed beta-propeller [Bacteroidales bacterium]|nr:6-bladed beta-propeller [Bacteroidales bacterium]